MSVFIEKITIKNLLSFDEEGITDFELKPLNVLIGANASGKSNFVHCLKIYCSTFGVFSETLDEFGGVAEVINKATKGSRTEVKVAKISANINFRFEATKPHYEISFAAPPDFLTNAVILNERLIDRAGQNKAEKVIFSRTLAELTFRPQSFVENQRVFSDKMQKIIIGDNHPAFERHEFIQDSVSNQVCMAFDNILQGSFYSMISPDSVRQYAKGNSSQVWVLNDMSNILPVLSRFDKSGLLDNTIIPLLKEVYPQIEGIRIHLLEGGRVTATIREQGMEPIAWTRASDGTLRFLALLAVLCNPYPPPLICIEEPENGLHPDVLRVLAKALKEASQRTQIIVTTHSPDLLGYMEPEDVVICERGEKGGTQMRRLSSETLKDWLKDYDLGQLWLSGELGGTRY